MEMEKKTISEYFTYIQNKLNFNFINDNEFSISLNEATEIEDINKIIESNKIALKNLQ